MYNGELMSLFRHLSSLQVSCLLKIFQVFLIKIVQPKLSVCALVQLQRTNSQFSLSNNLLAELLWSKFEIDFRQNKYLSNLRGYKYWSWVEQMLRLYCPNIIYCELDLFVSTPSMVAQQRQYHYGVSSKVFWICQVKNSYGTRTIITRSCFETALDYKPWISLKNFLVQCIDCL